MASSGRTRAARHAGSTAAAKEPPRALRPVSDTHQAPSDTPVGNRSGWAQRANWSSPKPASNPPTQPIRASNRLSANTSVTTWLFVNPMARSTASSLARSLTPIESVVKMINRAAKSAIPVAE